MYMYCMVLASYPGCLGWPGYEATYTWVCDIVMSYRDNIQQECIVTDGARACIYIVTTIEARSVV